MTERRGKFLLEQERVFDAPAKQVFELLTDPTLLATWWGPHGFSMPEIELDLRVGGRFRFTMQPPEGTAFHLSGEYVEVRPPERLTFTFRWNEPTPDDSETVVSLSLTPVGAATRVSLSHGEFATAERLELHRGGWADSFERLDVVLRSEGT